MSAVRCPTCGELVDSGPGSRCRGCGRLLADLGADDELRLPPVMREARRDIGAGSGVLVVLGVMVLGGLAARAWGWPIGIVLVLIIVAFTRSVARQNAADGGTGAAVAGVLDVVLRVVAVLFIAGIILVVGAFVFLYIVCLASGGGVV